jgi:hypothetical protein
LVWGFCSFAKKRRCGRSHLSRTNFGTSKNLK